MTATLYKHRVYCLYNPTGDITADVGTADTTLTVQQAVIDDAQIAVGAQIQLADGTDTSNIMTILAIDDGINTLTVDIAPGIEFLAATPTTVNPAPHWVYQWTDTSIELVQCPELASHLVQAGSASTVEVRGPDETQIRQSTAGFNNPTLKGDLPVAAASGATTTVDFTFDYPVTIQNVSGYVEQANAGDNFDFLVGPNTNSGLVTQAVLAADTVIVVDDAVIAVARPSLLIHLDEGATNDDLGHIVSVDKTAKTVTVSTAAVNAFTTAATILLTTACAIGALVPAFQTRITMGGDFFAGSEIPANMIIRLVYRNVGAAASRIIVHVKYLT